MKQTVIYKQVHPRWEVVTLCKSLLPIPSLLPKVELASTSWQIMADQIVKNLITAIGRKNKAATAKAGQIKNYMWIFIKSLIENLTFDSQTKETLTLPASKFGTKPVLSDDFMKKGRYLDRDALNCC
jgi:DNA topoisomerase II